jgi:hypothetical protein
MVDTVNLMFIQIITQRLVNFFGRLRIAPQRFFDHDAGIALTRPCFDNCSTTGMKMSAGCQIEQRGIACRGVQTAFQMAKSSGTRASILA